MKNKSLRSKIAMYAIAGAMAVSGVAGATLPASAANTENEKYTFSNTSISGTTRYRKKYNATKVYVYPTVGPQLYYRVIGSKSNSGDGKYRSSPVTIPLGVQASITNYVNENKETYAKLYMSRTKAVPVTTIGWWSPDSKNTYTVFPQ